MGWNAGDDTGNLFNYRRLVGSFSMMGFCEIFSEYIHDSLITQLSDQKQLGWKASTVFRETQVSLESGSSGLRIQKEKKTPFRTAFAGLKISQTLFRTLMLLSHVLVL